MNNSVKPGIHIVSNKINKSSVGQSFPRELGERGKSSLCKQVMSEPLMDNSH